MKKLTLSLILLTLPGTIACQTSSKSAGSNSLAQGVGVYSPPPPGLVRPRLGVPPMEVGSDASSGMEHLAADQLSTLLIRTDRFNVIERAQLQMLLNEQDLEGIVADGQLAQYAAVQGVDYLLIGKVTNLRTKAVETGGKSGLGKILGLAAPLSGGVAVVDVDSEKVEMEVECGVDLRLVDPSTGAALDASFAEYTRTDKASAFGIQVLGVGAEADAEIEMSEDDRGLIMRLAFDDAIKKMLPSLDRKLLERSRNMQAEAASAAAPAATPVSDTTTKTAAAFCSGCGSKVAAGAGFCGGCGAKIEG